MSLPLSPTSAHSFAGRPTPVEILLGDPEIVELAHGVGLQIDADAERAHVPHGFEDDAGHADLVKSGPLPSPPMPPPAMITWLFVMHRSPRHAP